MAARANPFQKRSPGPFRAPGGQPVEVLVTRGMSIESRHRVHIAVAGADGNIRASWGDLSLPVFPRSAIKPLQALPLFSAGVVEKYRLDHAELALACASHHGEKMHVEKVAAWLERIGCSEADLECGVHEPYHLATAKELVRRDQLASQLHNNCSGKHAGMLAACKCLGLPTRGYSNFDHPYQVRQRAVLGEIYGLNLDKNAWGIDGCGIPTYAVPLAKLARSMAVLGGGSFVASKIREAVVSLNEAIAAKPEFIGGSESFCSRVAAETRGKIFAKLGAEAVYGAWIPSAGIGIALKCEDGAYRASEAALVACLRYLGHELEFAQTPLVKRWGGEVVGEIYCF